MLSGAVTLLAAVLAWFAVQRQIGAQEDAENPPPIPFHEIVMNQHGALSKLAIYLRAFDDELADVYEHDSKV